MNECAVEKRYHRNPFTSEEDALLQQLVIRYGCSRWGKIAKMMPNRNIRQVKERWFNYLAPGISKTPWTDEEDQLLLSYINLIGRKWMMISKLFTGRTDTQVKSRYKVLVRKLSHELNVTTSVFEKLYFTKKDAPVSKECEKNEKQDAFIDEIFDNLTDEQFYDDIQF